MKNCFYKVVFVLCLVVSFLDHAGAQITATIDANNTTCGLNNGTAEVYPANAAGYNYKWSSGGSTTDTATGFAPGNYSVTVTNSTNPADSIVKTFTIGASGTTNITATATRDTICIGSSEWLHASGAASGTYTWSGGTLVAPVTGDSISISTIFPNSYTYTVKWGTNGCASASITIISRVFSATLTQDVNPSCGLNNGTLSYGITGGSNFQTTLLRNDTVYEHGAQTAWRGILAPGIYLFFVTDPATGCTDTVAVDTLVDNTIHPTFDSILITPETCFGNGNGAINVTVGNCAGGCTYSWSQSATDLTDSAIHLHAGTYTFSVSGGGCTNIDTTIIVPGPASALADTLRVHPDHCSQTVGAGIVLTGGGTGPYTYRWSLGTNLGDSVAQIAGDTTVYVTVTDSHGCADTLHAFIGNTSGPHASMNRPDTICYLDSIGILIVTPSTNDGPFTYLWSNGQTTNVDAGLFSGPYAVTVTDAVGCDTVLHDTIPSYIPTLVPTAVPGATVSLGQTVEITLQTNVPYTDIIWSPYIPGSRGSNVVSFKPDSTTTYSIVMTYGHSCVVTDTIQIAVFRDSSKFVIPNTFTPNGDHINDFFKLITYPDLGSFHIWIYDRWGNKMFESTDADFQWDGTDQYAGNKSPNTGVFAYVIEYTETISGKKGAIGGNISLVK